MWKIFKRKTDWDKGKPDIDLLNANCMECSHCNAVLSLMNYTPLSMEQCVECGASNFIPFLLKDYWLYMPLGGGGMGSVYKAFMWNNPKMEYAVKVLPRDKLDDERLVRSLLREAEIGKTFGRHPHLAYVADYGKFNREHYSVMEFCRGRRLDNIIEERDLVEPKTVLMWALQILSAENRMYHRGYLYRDLKPQNIIIDTEGNVCLVDYGLCLTIEEAARPKGEKVDGSPLYMPPERIVGGPEDMSGEIYSLGMVMFHVLTLKTYYSATGVNELARKHVTSLRVMSVANLMPGNMPPALVEILDRMIARYPKNRYGKYKDAAEEIRAVYETL